MFLPRGIALVGFMGAGKTTLARALGGVLRGRWVDLDQLIELQAGLLSVAEIFASEGEAGFREREGKALAEVLRGPPLVLACGGGTVALPGVMASLSDWGLTVYLKAPIAVLRARVGEGKGRPLWDEGAEALLEARAPLYEQAELVLDADQPVEVLVEAIAEALFAE